MNLKIGLSTLQKLQKLSKTPFEETKMVFTVRISVYDTNIPRAPHQPEQKVVER